MNGNNNQYIVMKNFNRKRLILFILKSWFLTAVAQQAKDIKFVQHVAADGKMEVQLGQLAQTNAGASEIKVHGLHMVDDHGKVNDELTNLANKKNISITASSDDKMKRKYDKLAALQGNEFDRKYARCMVHGHKKAICLFKKEAKKGKDPELKAWANDKIPVLNEHLTMWKEAYKVTQTEKQQARYDLNGKQPGYRTDR
jgi:putative membrane protein